MVDHTKLLLDHLQYLFLVEFLGETLNGGQSLTAIAFYDQMLDCVNNGHGVML